MKTVSVTKLLSDANNTSAVNDKLCSLQPKFYEFINKNKNSFSDDTVSFLKELSSAIIDSKAIIQAHHALLTNVIDSIEVPWPPVILKHD